MSGDFGLDLSLPISLRIEIGIIASHISAEKEMAPCALIDLTVIVRDAHRRRMIFKRRAFTIRLADNRARYSNCNRATLNSCARARARTDRHSMDYNTREFLIALIMTALASAYKLVNRSISINNNSLYIPAAYLRNV